MSSHRGSAGASRDPQFHVVAQGADQKLTSYTVGALPILNVVLQRLRLQEFLRESLPADDPRMRIPTASGLLVLLRNLLASRDPIYGVGEWATRYAPDLLGLTPKQVCELNDDRVGRCLDRLFDANCGTLALSVAAQAVREFGVSLEELHNDSTTVTFQGAYREAAQASKRRGQPTRAITWGHNKDHRPDLKQLLYILTVTEDGGVPVQFRVESGNTVDDQTHQTTWDLLCQLSGRRDFLYVADSKLATRENMAYVHQRGGRFISVLPRTRAEDGAFRELVMRQEVSWRHLWDKSHENGQLLDRFSVSEPATPSVEGYRLLWYHSTRKAELDALARSQRIERALRELAELREKLCSPRTRYRQAAKVTETVEKLLAEREVGHWITVQVDPRVVETYRQERRGRPNKETRYVKQVAVRFDLTIGVDQARINQDRRCDGVFPLITNVFDRSELELLWAYKKQPTIEKRFSQLKTDFAVAPVYLKDVSRIQALLCVYFFALLVEALVERDLRCAMERAEVEALALYPEGRACRHPTTRRLIDLFDNVQRHVLRRSGQAPTVLLTELSAVQRRVLRLLGLPRDDYGHPTAAD